MTTTEPPRGAVRLDGLHSNMAMVPLRITWSWPARGRSGVYEDDPSGDHREWRGYLHNWLDWQLHDYWWAMGNGSCDCNRARTFCGEEVECGDEILIGRIEAIGVEGVNPIVLEESHQ